MARVTRRDWLETGLYLLVREDPAALTIGALCRHLEMTKGSFHHYFDRFDGYLRLYGLDEEGGLTLYCTPMNAPHAMRRYSD